MSAGVLWSQKEHQHGEGQNKTNFEQEQRAKDNSDYAAKRSIELARELANWRDWMDLVKTLQH